MNVEKQKYVGSLTLAVYVQRCVDTCGLPSAGRRNRFVKKCSILPADIANGDWESAMQ